MTPVSVRLFFQQIDLQCHVFPFEKLLLNVRVCLPSFLMTSDMIKLRASNLAGVVYSQRPCEQKPLKNLGEKWAWAYPRTAEIFFSTPIISGTGKATNFQLCTHILSIDGNKSPLQISGKVAVG